MGGGVEEESRNFSKTPFDGRKYSFENSARNTGKCNKLRSVSQEKHIF